MLADHARLTSAKQDVRLHRTKCCVWLYAGLVQSTTAAGSTCWRALHPQGMLMAPHHQPGAAQQLPALHGVPQALKRPSAATVNAGS